MFSISTIASSTSTPITSVSASRETPLSVKSSRCMPMKAGSTDMGSATADRKVARQLRRKNHTTITASAAPS